MSEIALRPDWWRPGLPLPHLYARTEHTGTGKIGGGGKVTSKKIPCRWETTAEWQARRAMIDEAQHGP